MQITVHVRSDTALKLREQQTTPEASEIVQVVEDEGAILRPMHPMIEDQVLASFFIVEVPDIATAERVITRLHSCEAVEAAYLKPPASPA